jgi:hypothetical protein
MNNIMHEHLNKLRIISKVRSGQRLDTTTDLTVYEESLYNWALRKWYHDNKDEGVRYLQELYRSIQQSVGHLISEINITSHVRNKHNKIQVAINLAEKLKDSVFGVENLSKTYSPYPKTTATLEGIIQDYAIGTYTQLLDAIPKNRHTPSLKESITYHGVILHLGISATIQDNPVNREISLSLNTISADTGYEDIDEEDDEAEDDEAEEDEANDIN